MVRHLSERMVKAGHDVTAATTKLSNRKSIDNGVKVIELSLAATL